MFKPGDIVLLGDIQEHGFCMRNQVNMPVVAFPVPALVVEVYGNAGHQPAKIYVEWVHPMSDYKPEPRFHKWNFRERHFNQIELLEEM